MKTCSCCNSTKSKKMKKGLWSPDEDHKLAKFVTKHGIMKWSQVPVSAGLERCGKSCRLRWLNYLRPGIKRGEFSAQEQKLMFDLHSIYGNRWSLIAQHIAGRTDNEIKNFWNLRRPSKTPGFDVVRGVIYEPKRASTVPGDCKTPGFSQVTSYRLAVPFRIDICEPNFKNEAEIQCPVDVQQGSFFKTEESNGSCSSPSIESEMKSLYDLISFPDDAAVHEHTDLFYLLQPDSLPYLGIC